ncbi:MAG: permease-like cell division protein FtsX [Bacillus sp. (in: Bacteria)]|nr:permease-like cell division protein FtsX [Bacillus sp. (in: firmicutes)]MCM1425220.1 permease-like cell division protein FtsX [Eubacterium sp.]
MRINTLFYTLRQGIRNIFRNKWFTLASIATISACLFLFGLFYTIVSNFQNIVKTAEQGVSVTVFFDAGLEDSRIQEIGEMIARRTEVSNVHFVSAEEAWDSFKTEYLGEYADGFTENPLADSANYQIYLNDVSMQSALVTYLESISGVRQVNRSEITATTLTGVNALVAYVSVGIIAILLAVSIFLISNTVMIGISVRKEEINIMKYIGATDFFVRSPFVIEGMLIGLIGAAIPLGIIYVLYNVVMEYILERFSMLTQLLSFLTVGEIFHVLIPVSLGIGVGIGFLGSVSTVRKHLRV